MENEQNGRGMNWEGGELYAEEDQNHIVSVN